MGQIKLLSPSVRIKKEENITLRFLRYQFFTYYDKLGISPKQF